MYRKKIINDNYIQFRSLELGNGRVLPHPDGSVQHRESHTSCHDRVNMRLTLHKHLRDKIVFRLIDDVDEPRTSTLTVIVSLRVAQGLGSLGEVVALAVVSQLVLTTVSHSMGQTAHCDRVLLDSTLWLVSELAVLELGLVALTGDAVGGNPLWYLCGSRATLV